MTAIDRRVLTIVGDDEIECNQFCGVIWRRQVKGGKPVCVAPDSPWIKNSGTNSLIMAYPSKSRVCLVEGSTPVKKP